ncbi:bolA-like protein 2 [Trichonephila clavata]|uniref:BolA-like protein 2 n=1 Tax=Trichonephila clavata TaxID=2740835 RepID=A0A8X6H014_TRICU|nr:bolA-like protein 2 [Trichonephila clavata]
MQNHHFRELLEHAIVNKHFFREIKKELETTYILVEDLSDGCGAKFNAIIVTPKFEGVPLLQRHRMVNEILKEEMNSSMLSLKRL